MQTRTEDAGQYTCVVRNAAGEERKIFRLSVLGIYTAYNIDSMDLSLSKLWQMVKDREAWPAAVCSPWGHKESDMTE